MSAKIIAKPICVLRLAVVFQILKQALRRNEPLHRWVTARQISTAIEASPKTAKRDIEQLRELGLEIRCETNRGLATKYMLVTPGCFFCEQSDDGAHGFTDPLARNRRQTIGKAEL